MATRIAGTTLVVVVGAFGGAPTRGAAQSADGTLDERLLRESPATLAAAARDEGDARRGAAVFFQPGLSCSRCHAVGEPRSFAGGPDLAALGGDADVDDVVLVDALLRPSLRIRDGFRSAVVELHDGTTHEGLLVARTAESIVLRDVARAVDTTFATAECRSVKESRLSAMPAGQMAQLASRQQFLDLVRWLIEVREGGAARARELAPAPEVLALVLPEYESRVDHAGLIARWDSAAFERGEAIYRRVCANCHGTRDQVGSLPGSLRFAEGEFKNGSDPLAIYRTLTHGFGAMPPQTWMVPKQKYDVIHYLREGWLRPYNPTQYRTIDAEMVAALPRGDTLGPEPSAIEAWSAMDYGPSLSHTFEVARTETGAAPGPDPNFAYKGLAIRLDPGAGGVARGRHWILFEHDTLRVAAAWSAPEAVASRGGGGGAGFIDWRGIQFNGEHKIHPRIVGDLAFSNPAGPGWADPRSGSFADDQRVIGRDGRRYGPLPREWARLRGVHHHGSQLVLDYRVGTSDVLELPRLLEEEAPRSHAFLRTLNVGPREHELVLQVATHADRRSTVTEAAPGDPSVVRFGRSAAAESAELAEATARAARTPLVFDGVTFVEIADGEAFDLTTCDFTISTRFRTTEGGTLFAVVAPGPAWTPDGQSLFVRDGRLCFDIGWVGCVTSRARVDDGAWHDVAATWRQSDGRLRLWIDGRLEGEGTLAARSAPAQRVVRVGFTAPDFPAPRTFFHGEIESLRFDARGSAEAPRHAESAVAESVAAWSLAKVVGPVVGDASGNGREGSVRRGTPLAPAADRPLRVGVTPPIAGARFEAAEGALRLRLPAGSRTLRFTLWTALDSGLEPPPTPRLTDGDRDLTPLTNGGPRRWPQELETKVAPGRDGGPFAIDTLTPPDVNPWLAQLRFTGLDFLPDGRMAACTWDGDVWLVEFVTAPSEAASDAAPAAEERAAVPTRSSVDQRLRWRRIATGLFQPLGLKVVRGLIHLTCRDQLAVLHDRNGDDEIDFVECLNSDHQVTEHFHEFAMGLQTDAAGNFHYAKSGRHALPAVVPQHGTLLRVSPDGATTTILANGFRAANGVCVEDDGSFVVTDQEGFWMPKNRINWVRPGGDGRPRFHGNMLGWHDGVDASDAAMEPPLCWITNAFDRSPAEALRVESAAWDALDGALLCSSYGEGKLFLVLNEPVPGRDDGARQGALLELPGVAFPTGVMRGRFHADGALYLAGMFAWAGDAVQPGGLYRVRATGRPARLPLRLHATKRGLELAFTEPLDPAGIDPPALAAGALQVRVWSLKRTAEYGSDHYDERPLAVRNATLSADGRILGIEIADLAPTWCYELRYSLRARDGAPVNGVIHGTIHALAD
jgi:putative heme-binding domain-containing protein